MNSLVHQYLRNQLNQAPSLLQSYTHDANGRPYLSLEIFGRLQSLINEFLSGHRELRIVAVPGLRGVGKTTLLAQLFMDLHTKHVPDLLYISVDQVVNVLNSDLNTVFEEYQTILGTSFEATNRKLFIFIDEIHFDSKWTSVLKMPYDRSKNLFIVCTGSSALSFQSTADLARRVIFEKLYPMSFTEYMLLKTKYLSSNDPVSLKSLPSELSTQLKQALFHSQTAQECFNILQTLAAHINQYWSNIDQWEVDRYLKFGTMPFALTFQEESRILELTNQLVDKVVEKDLLEHGKFETNTIEAVKNILLMVSASSETSVTSLAASLSNISINTLISVFATLEKAEMLIRVYPYGSAYKKVRKPSKYHFMTPAVRHSLLSIVEGESAYRNHKGKYLEDIVALTLYREFGAKLSSPLFYDSAKGGADFILSLARKKVAIEVGHGNKDTKQVQVTLQKIKGDYGLVISNSQLSQEDNIIKVPLEYFLLM